MNRLQQTTGASSQSGRRAPLPATRYSLLLLVVGCALGVVMIAFTVLKRATSTKGGLSQTQASQVANSNVRAAEKWESATAVKRRVLMDRISFALKGIADEADSNRREQLWASFLAGFTPEEIPSALFLLDDLHEPELYTELQQRLMQHWAKTDIQKASAWAMALPEGALREQTLEQVAITWAELDLKATEQWAKQLPEADRNKTWFTIATEAIRSQPVEAVRLAGELPPSDARIDLFCRAAGEWAASDSRAAADWAAKIFEPVFREQVIAKVVVTWSEKDPISAATFALDEMPAGKLQSDTVVAIVQRWAQKAPEAAASWVAQFPPGAVREAAVENLYAQWFQTDAVRAAQWQSQLHTHGAM
ncbi:MAG: hypothetical protein H7Y43_00785 [Akkermansiaceae bacterium]|nr:hypothetical protein [Verrucomicrobiales bacterium]